MSGMGFPYGETVTVRRAPEKDRYGDRVPGSDVEFKVRGCGFAPRASSELEDQRSTVIVGYTMYAPVDADIRATDTVTRVSGTRWRVQGEPGQWRSPLSGWDAGLEVALTRVTG